MAEDQERADRLRTLKDEYPSVTWRQLAEHVGVRERSVLNWAAGKGMDYDHAVKVAEFFRDLGEDIADDYVWRGLRANTPTPFAVGDETAARMAALEGDLKQLLHDRESLRSEIAQQNALLARQSQLLERIESLVRVLEHAEVTEPAAAPDVPLPGLPLPSERAAQEQTPPGQAIRGPDRRDPRPRRKTA
jgi:hypothetical protein